MVRPGLHAPRGHRRSHGISLALVRLLQPESRAMIITRRCEHSDSSHHAHHTQTGGGQTGLLPAARFEEMLVRALTAAPERTPPSGPGRAAVFYVDVDRFELASAGLT